jgi:hypothetical protein
MNRDDLVHIYSKANIDGVGAQLEDGRNVFRIRNHGTRRLEIENFTRLFGRLSSYGRTITYSANNEFGDDEFCEPIIDEVNGIHRRPERV